MNNMIWDAVLWLRKKLSKDKEDIIEAVNNIQNLFETSADATASSSDILAGKTAYNGTVLLTGIMKDRRGITVTAGATTQDDEYTYLTVPEEACFNASSKLRTKNSNIRSNFERYTGVAIVKQKNDATNASETYTAVNDLEDLIVTVYLVSEGAGGGNYTTTIHSNGKLIAANANDFFSLGSGLSKFVSLKKGQTVSIVNSGKATTATDYPYRYGTTIYRLI